MPEAVAKPVHGPDGPDGPGEGATSFGVERGPARVVAFSDGVIAIL
ncbi:hypothetical protein [Streptomyces mirabilis]